MLKTLLTTLFTLTLLPTPPAHAWNALGHKIIAEIAWQQLTPNQRTEIIKILHRHPKFDTDFAQKGDIQDDQWIFHQAAIWPDTTRNDKTHNQPTWHYINYPHQIENPTFGTDYPKPNLNTQPTGRAKDWNIIQAINFCQKILKSQAPPNQKALAYSWLIHLVGDIHQPLHTITLYSNRHPNGDRGGNDIPLQISDNLHTLIDNQAGRQHKPNDIKREVAKLQSQPHLWDVKKTTDPEQWAKTAHQIAKTTIYTEEITNAIKTPGQLTKIPINIKQHKAYKKASEQQIVAAGIQLGNILGGTQEITLIKPTPPPTKPKNTPHYTQPEPYTPSYGYWLTTSSGIRHNSNCQFYHNSKGRACTASEGRACKNCGG